MLEEDEEFGESEQRRGSLIDIDENELQKSIMSQLDKDQQHKKSKKTVRYQGKSKGSDFS